MTNLSILSQDEVSENQVIRSRVAKTQQPDAKRLTSIITNYFEMYFIHCIFIKNCFQIFDPHMSRVNFYEKSDLSLIGLPPFSPWYYMIFTYFIAKLCALEL